MTSVFDLTRKAKALKNSLLNVPEIEQKVREATSNDPWGASGTLKSEIAHATHNYNDFRIIMDTIWKRLGDTGKNWRHVYKGLQLLEYLLAHGDRRVVEEAKDALYTIRTLRDFQYVDENGKDHGLAVRELSKKLVRALTKPEVLAEMRETASQKKEMQGFSAEEMSRYSSRSNYSSSYSSSRTDSARSTPRYDSDKESGDEEEEEEEKPKTTSTTTTTTQQKQASAQPAHQIKVSPKLTPAAQPPKQPPTQNLVDFLGGTTTTTTITTASVQQVDDPFGDPFAAPLSQQQQYQQPQQWANFGSSSGNNADEFTADDFADFQKAEKKDSFVSGIPSNLVNLGSLSISDDKNKKADQSGKKPTLNDLMRQKGVNPTTTTTTVTTLPTAAPSPFLPSSQPSPFLPSSTAAPMPTMGTGMQPRPMMGAAPMGQPMMGGMGQPMMAQPRPMMGAAPQPYGGAYPAAAMGGMQPMMGQPMMGQPAMMQPPPQQQPRPMMGQPPMMYGQQPQQRF